MVGIRALLVDDEIELRKLLQDDLSARDWTVDVACDGQQALQQLKNKSYDIIVSDIRMPKVDGIRLLFEVRKTDSKCTFVLMSAFADIPLWEAYAMGANGFVGKPFRMGELEELLENMQKPIVQRWSDIENKRSTWNVSQHIIIDENPAAQNFSLGTGGMFVDPGPNSIRKGQIISFEVKTAHYILDGVGKVQWRRSSGESNLAKGLGLEFLFLEEPARSTVASIIANNKDTAFIPRGSQLRHKLVDSSGRPL